MNPGVRLTNIMKRNEVLATRDSEANLLHIAAQLMIVSVTASTPACEVFPKLGTLL